MPDYQIPGRAELPVNVVDDPYGEAGCSMTVNKGRPQTAFVKPPSGPKSVAQSERPITAKPPSIA